MRLSLLLACLAVSTPAAYGQTLFDFESGVQGWGPSGFGNGTEFANSTIFGATEGSLALAFGHDNGQFSWDGSWVTDDMNDPVYQAISAAAADPTGKTIDFDITYRSNDLTTFQSFVNLTFSLQSDNGFKQVNNLATVGSTDPRDVTIPVSIPLDGPADSGDISGFNANSSFYRMTFALNTDAGVGTNTAYVDNIRIVNPIPEPGTALLALTALAGLASRRR